MLSSGHFQNGLAIARSELSSSASAYIDKEDITAEIQMLRDQMNITKAKSTASSEQVYWNKLIDSNIRAGTLACMWCLKAQVVKKVSLAFYKWKYTSMFNPTVSPSKSIHNSANNNRNISSALESAVSLMSRMKSPAKDINSATENRKYSDESKISTSQHQSILSSIMDSLQYNKSNSEHLDRYLREALVHKETDFETKRKLLLAMSNDIIDRGYKERHSPEGKPIHKGLRAEPFGDQSTILNSSTNTASHAYEDIDTFSPLSKQDANNASSRSLRNQSSSRLARNSSVQSMQASAMQKKLSPRSPASSLSAVNMNNMLSSADNLKSPTSRMVNRMIQQFHEDSEEEEEDASQETYSVVTHYREDEELELLRTLEQNGGDDQYHPRSLSAQRTQRPVLASLDVSHNSNSSVTSRHTNNNSVISVAAPLGSSAKGGTFSRSPARGRNTTDDHINEFKYLMFKNTDSGNYVRELISPRSDNKRSQSVGSVRSASAEHRRGNPSSSGNNNGTSNRLHNSESHHPPHSVFSFSGFADPPPSQMKQHHNMSPPRHRMSNSSDVNRQSQSQQRDHSHHHSLDASYHSGHGSNSVPRYLLPTNSYMKKILSPEEKTRFQTVYNQKTGKNSTASSVTSSSRQMNNSSVNNSYAEIYGGNQSNGGGEYRQSSGQQRPSDQSRHHQQRQQHDMDMDRQGSYEYGQQGVQRDVRASQPQPQPQSQQQYQQTSSQNTSARLDTSMRSGQRSTSNSRPTSAGNRSIVDHHHRRHGQSQSHPSVPSAEEEGSFFGDTRLQHDLRRVLGTESVQQTAPSSVRPLSPHRGVNVYENLQQSLTQLSTISPSEPQLTQAVANISTIVNTLAQDSDAVSVTSTNRYLKSHSAVPMRNLDPLNDSMSSTGRGTAYELPPSPIHQENSTHFFGDTTERYPEEQSFSRQSYQQPYIYQSQQQQHQQQFADQGGYSYEDGREMEDPRDRDRQPFVGGSDRAQSDYDDQRSVHSHHSHHSHRSHQSIHSHHSAMPQQHYQQDYQQQQYSQSYDAPREHGDYRDDSRQTQDYADDVPEYSDASYSAYQQQQQQQGRHQGQSHGQGSSVQESGRRRGAVQPAAKTKKRPEIDPAQMELFYGHLGNRKASWRSGLRR